LPENERGTRHGEKKEDGNFLHASHAVITGIVSPQQGFVSLLIHEFAPIGARRFSRAISPASRGARHSAAVTHPGDVFTGFTS